MVDKVVIANNMMIVTTIEEYIVRSSMGGTTRYSECAIPTFSSMNTHLTTDGYCSPPTMENFYHSSDIVYYIATTLYG